MVDEKVGHGCIVVHNEPITSIKGKHHGSRAIGGS